MGLTVFERALIAHLVADWLLQNDWMARNKKDLRHPAAWVHAAIYGLLLGVALGWLGGLVLGTLHVVIDTGWPVNWWLRAVKKCERAPQIDLIRVGTDQAVHVALIAGWIALALS